MGKNEVESCLSTASRTDLLRHRVVLVEKHKGAVGDLSRCFPQGLCEHVVLVPVVTRGQLLCHNALALCSVELIVYCA